MRSRVQLILLPVGMIAVLTLFVLVQRRPGLFANTTYLGAILALQIALIGLSHFEEMFFPLLMGTFIWAGTSLPFAGTGMTLRWFFLGMGAFGGFVIWIKRPRMRHFGLFHLVALFCVLSALVSAVVSDAPRTALLKVLSLFLLFLYTSSGARLAATGRKFMGGLVLTCEILVYFSAVCYFVLDFGVFGNPNSLGAIIGVAALPVLLCGAVAAETPGLRWRRFFALALCGALLYLANSRASTLAATVAVLVLMVSARHQRLLLRCAFASLFFLAVMAVVNPSHMDEMVSSFTGRVLYKEGGTTPGLLGSRLGPWTETLAAVKQRPWFGSGFGTSEMADFQPDLDPSSVYTKVGTNQEHGSSYLAMAEYMGLLGIVPFLLLLLMLVRALVRIFSWMRRTGNPYHHCIPFALVATAGLVHACFEDWMFAVGSYLCVFFWVMAFALMDLIPEAHPRTSTAAIHRRPGDMASPASLAHSLR
ncbi:MAG: O-antigen ligase family protein [Candidatus Sulfotelmatobacter sp.]